MSYTDKEKKPTHPPSDGSELIPAEVQANTRQEKETGKSLNQPLERGYTRDDEGIVNNYAIEPEMSKAKYPSSKQQRRYLLLGAAAILFVALIIRIVLAIN
jgi:hypothetical protein